MASAAGTSALAMYRRARWRRRRRIAYAVAFGAVAAAAAAVSAPPAVALLGAAAGIVCLVGAGFGRPGADPARWERGADGERRTAELLGGLAARRWAVWHDLPVPGSRANIDHVIVGRTGVWVVDTKSTRAAVRAGRRSVRFGERRLDTSTTLWEAEALAAEIEARLGAVPGRGARVRAVVAVHGSGLRRRGARVSGVDVVPADELVSRVARGRRRLSRADRRAVGAALGAAFGPPASGPRHAGGGRGRAVRRHAGVVLEGSGSGTRTE